MKNIVVKNIVVGTLLAKTFSFPPTCPSRTRRSFLSRIFSKVCVNVAHVAASGSVSDWWFNGDSCDGPKQPQRQRKGHGRAATRESSAGYAYDLASVVADVDLDLDKSLALSQLQQQQQQQAHAQAQRQAQSLYYQDDHSSFELDHNTGAAQAGPGQVCVTLCDTQARTAGRRRFVVL